MTNIAMKNLFLKAHSVLREIQGIVEHEDFTCYFSGESENDRDAVIELSDALTRYFGNDR